MSSQVSLRTPFSSWGAVFSGGAASGEVVVLTIGSMQRSLSEFGIWPGRMAPTRARRFRDLSGNLVINLGKFWFLPKIMCPIKDRQSACLCKGSILLVSVYLNHELGGGRLMRDIPWKNDTFDSKLGD